MEIEGTATTRYAVARAIETQRPFLFTAMAMAILYVIATSLWSSALPANYWMSVKLVYVSDTHVGTPPLMQEELEVRRPVLGERVVTVLQKQASGALAQVCSSRVWVDYDSGVGLPDAFALDWWMGRRKCPLVVGEYVVQTSWYLHPVGHYPKELHVRSNMFKVLP